MGVAGGNGLEHIDNTVTEKVIGIDINQQYLDVVHARYNDKIDSLELLNLDITKSSETIADSDFIWAALVLEYTGINKALEFVKNNLRTGGHIIISIQSNNGVQSVSQTGIESVNKVGSIFQVIEPDSGE